MNIPIIDLNTEYLRGRWKLLQEQAKTARLIRRYMRLTNGFNPFADKSKINNILKRYEKGFWA